MLPERPTFDDLVRLVARLRGPDGCPWDRQQTHQSLRATFLQECYEVLEALDAGDMKALREELGDLLLHVVLQAQIASEEGEFTIDDSIGDICRKLVRRHPHVFGSARAADAEAVARGWEGLKRDEKGGDGSMLDGVPATMPALGYSQEIQARVARAGFDWEDDAGVVEKLAEEVSELLRAETAAQRQQEFGDLLFTLANIARRQGIDLEAALRGANRKFYRRFARMEELCRERGLSFAGLSFEQQNALWEEVKRLAL